MSGCRVSVSRLLSCFVRPRAGNQNPGGKSPPVQHLNSFEGCDRLLRQTKGFQRIFSRKPGRGIVIRAFPLSQELLECIREAFDLRRKINAARLLASLETRTMRQPAIDLDPSLVGPFRLLSSDETICAHTG